MTSAIPCILNCVLSLCFSLLTYLTPVVVVLALFKIWLKSRKFQNKGHSEFISVGFFHPYCNAGGGGERVLWTAIRLLQNTHDNVKCVVYTGDVTATKEDILKKVEDQFKITLRNNIEFVYLQKRGWVEAKLYPFFTLLLQSLASVFLGIEAIWQFVPDIYIDTMGYAFTLPIFKYLGGCRTGCYVHYPTISTDMLEAVFDRRITVNNRELISNSTILSHLKVYYYKAFAFLYGFVGSCADVVMVNSTWTEGHINSIWKVPSKTNIVYPPCNTSAFEEIPLKRTVKQRKIISIAQFRPEKNHELQLRSIHNLLALLPAEQRSEVCLLMIGGCRDEEDFRRVEDLKKLIEQLDIEENVQIKVNLSFDKLLEEMGNCQIALHTMSNEHFGIGVVECMSAGLIVIAHDSGGPKLDIVVDQNGRKCGYLAEDETVYSARLEALFMNSEDELSEIGHHARESARRFSEENFENAFLESTEKLFL